MEQPRKSGIPALRDLAWGTHFSLFYKTKEELLEVLVPYFKAGLENNEYCVWVTCDPLPEEDARAALVNAVPDYPTYVKNGQIEILPHDEWYLKGGTFDAQRVLARWVEREKSAIGKGYDGVRLSGNAFWLESHQWKAFIQYESEVNTVISANHLIALCSYSFDKCSALNVLDVIRTHEFAIVKRDGEWQRFESATTQNTKQALAVSEKLRDKLYHSMKEGVSFHKMVYDNAGHAVDYVITSVNPAFEVITGLNRDAAVGRRASELYGTGTPPYLEIYAEVAGTGESTSFETYFPPMAKYFNISVFSPEKGEFATVFTDVTKRKKEEEELKQRREHLAELVEARTRELRDTNQSLEAEVMNRKQAEDAAKAQRQLFNDVLDTLPCYLVLLTPDHHVPFANRFFRERFGESHGKRCFEYLFNRTEPCEVCETYKVLDKMQPLRWEWVGPDGHNYDIYDFPFHDVDGSTLIMETGIDVTEQKKTQLALRESYAELERRVQERTLELQNKTEELVRSNQDLETFAFAASHDLQEPLRTVSSFVQLLAQRYGGRLDAEADKYVHLVTDGTSRMNTMIADLLQFSRIQSRGAPFNTVDLNQAFHDALANLSATIKESSATVTSDPLPTISGDTSQLTQIFQNLVGNGIKYRKTSETPIIHVGTIPTEPGRDVHLYVRDNGIGIDPKHHDKLFVIFHRLHAWGKYPGTGVGLAICKKIVERHGGRIWVESTLGKGSTFHFTLKN